MYHIRTSRIMTYRRISNIDKSNNREADWTAMNVESTKTQCLFLSAEMIKQNTRGELRVPVRQDRGTIRRNGEERRAYRGRIGGNRFYRSADSCAISERRNSRVKDEARECVCVCVHEIFYVRFLIRKTIEMIDAPFVPSLSTVRRHRLLIGFGDAVLFRRSTSGAFDLLGARDRAWPPSHREQIQTDRCWSHVSKY